MVKQNIYLSISNLAFLNIKYFGEATLWTITFFCSKATLYLQMSFCKSQMFVTENKGVVFFLVSDAYFKLS